MNNIENIEIFVGHNWDNLSDAFKSDWAALAKQRNQDTGEVDQDLLNAFIKKHKTDFMHNKGGEIVDLNASKPLIERMQADSVDFSDTSSVYDQNLARKYNVADPNTVRETRAKEQTRLEKEAADRKRAEEYKKLEQERYARQKAVSDYQHSYLGMDLDNPINKAANWLADLVISDNTRKSIIDDPNNSSGIWANAATDYFGTAADFVPGYGVLGKGLGLGIKTFAGPLARTAQNVANGKGALETGKEAIVDFGVAGLGAKGAKKLKMKATDDAVDAAENATKIGAGSDYAKTLAAELKTESFKDVREGLHRVEVNILGNKEALAEIRSMQPKEWASFKRDFKGTSLEEFFENIPYEKRNNIHDYFNDFIEKGEYHWNNDKAAAEVFKKSNPKSYALYKGVNKTLDKAVPVVSKGSHFASRKAAEVTPYKTSDPNKSMKAERDRDVIDWYKENYADQWIMGFKPRPVNGELMMKAWQEGHDEGKW